MPTPHTSHPTLQGGATVAPFQDQGCHTPPNSHSSAHAPDLEPQPLCVPMLQTSALWLLCPCPYYKFWLSSQSTSAYAQDTRAWALQQEHPQPRPIASLTELHGDCAAMTSSVLEPPHPTQPESSHPQVGKDLSLLKPVYEVWKR